VRLNYAHYLEQDTEKNMATKQKAAAAGARGLHITEGVSGYYHYHLSESNTNATALCGKMTMNTSILLSTWGHRGHLSETYCAACEQAGLAELTAAGATVGSAKAAA
jgi:hypothetical protein